MKQNLKRQLLSLLVIVGTISMNAQTLVYQIKKGDTLGSVANAYGVSEDALQKANPKMGDYFYTGMKIVIPSKGETSTTTEDANMVRETITTVENEYQQSMPMGHEQALNMRSSSNKYVKHGEKYYGTRQGGFAISFGADPILNFIGNMFNGTTNQKFEGFKGLGSDLFEGATITGKYMLKDNLALTLGLGFNSKNEKSFNYSDAEKLEEETNVKSTGSNKFMLLVGTQFLLRPGKRLQPILGANLAYGYANNNYERNDAKIEEGKDTYIENPAHTFGILGNIGVEYYITKAISLSATVDLGVCKTWTKEKRDDGEEDTKYSRKSSTSTNLKTGQFGGNFAVNFYF